jgi:LPS export ABC transporter protein LptC
MREIQSLSFFLFLLTLVSSACSNSEAELNRFREDQQAGVERAEEVEMLYSDSAIVRTRIQAPLMLQYNEAENPRRIFPKGVVVDIYDERKQPNSKITARYAEYLNQQKKVFLRDSVKVWNNQGERLETQELIWSEIDSSISSTKFVRITTPNEEITGYGFHSNTSFSNWRISKVSGVVQKKSVINIGE